MVFYFDIHFEQHLIETTTSTDSNNNNIISHNKNNNNNTILGTLVNENKVDKRKYDDCTRFDIMDYMNKPVFDDENKEYLVNNFKNLAKNIEILNTSTYDYITAAEEEYEVTGKVLGSTVYSTIFAYLDASFYYLISNFDKKKMFYENHNSCVDYEIFNNNNNDSIWCADDDEESEPNSKWDMVFVVVENQHVEKKQCEKTIIDEIFNRISNLDSINATKFNYNAEIASPVPNRSWTVAPKLINNTNITVVNKKQMTINNNNIDPIGTKPRSMSTLSNNKNGRLNRLNNNIISEKIKIETPIFNEATVWGNNDSLTPVFEYSFVGGTSQNGKYKVSKLVSTLVNDVEKMYASNYVKNVNNMNETYHQQQQNRVRSCYDYRQNYNRQKCYKIDNTRFRPLMESSSSLPFNESACKYKYKRK
jgi:hypothetical protein